jgi:ATP-dependent RNA helicase DDX23/PRP28
MADNNEGFETYLASLSPEDQQQALAAAEAAQRAEERAEQRALEHALREKEEERRREKLLSTSASTGNGISAVAAPNAAGKVVFIPKRKRDELKSGGGTGNAAIGEPPVKPAVTNGNQKKVPPLNGDRKSSALSEKERKALVETYMGKSALNDEQEEIKKKKKHRNNKKITFKFRWDDTDDTLNDEDPLYAPVAPSRLQAPPLDRHQRNQRKLQNMIGGEVSSMHTVTTKPLGKMTARDWRIFRENYEIIVKGGKAPPPMRSFREPPDPLIPHLHPALLDAIENVMRFKEPSPIQRQAIPIGLQRRDLIGIAETGELVLFLGVRNLTRERGRCGFLRSPVLPFCSSGSGKTVAFGVPLCQYLLNLPKAVLHSVADQGPLALVMAPTRELALQIDVELTKLLSRQSVIHSLAVVGGQPIQHQAQAIRKGVHMIVGTPGRINDCIEMAYLVLNQCCYIVLDEVSWFFGCDGSE